MDNEAVELLKMVAANLIMEKKLGHDAWGGLSCEQKSEILDWYESQKEKTTCAQ